MVEIIIATHGQLSAGIKDAVNVITGSGDFIKTLSLNREDNLDDFEAKFVSLIEQASEGALVFVDMIGGSPYNVAMKYLESLNNYNVLTGVNINMLLEILGDIKSKDVATLSRIALNTGKDAINEYGQLHPKETKIQENTIDIHQSNAPAEITLARVDHRLIHGQVVTKWSKIAHAETIIIVDDELSKDDYMIEVYRSSAPSGIEVIVAPTDIVGYASTHGTLPPGKIMLLFRNLKNVKEAMRQGLTLEKLQLGGIPNDGNKRMVFQAVNLSKEDLEDLQNIESQGTTVSIQVIPEEPGITLKDAERKFN